jgi:hypothetical protein
MHADTAVLRLERYAAIEAIHAESGLTFAAEAERRGADPGPSHARVQAARSRGSRRVQP